MAGPTTSSRPPDAVADPDAPLVEIDGLTFRYRRATEPAIRDLSLDGRAGRGPARGRAVGLRQEHADPGDQRAHPACLSRAS